MDLSSIILQNKSQKVTSDIYLKMYDLDNLCWIKSLHLAIFDELENNFSTLKTNSYINNCLF